ncbi:hypothetical protein [Photobacterium satsumensis]|uniref:hypothetical protein n=1 Tax=Photobacterium satsumensis TaxID=2910239 RepID=UPI003D10A6D7
MYEHEDIENELEYKGFSIFIEDNPDQYSEGVEYSVSRGTDILEIGLEFSFTNAVTSAKSWVDENT